MGNERERETGHTVDYGGNEKGGTVWRSVFETGSETLLGWFLSPFFPSCSYWWERKLRLHCLQYNILRFFLLILRQMFPHNVYLWLRFCFDETGEGGLILIVEFRISRQRRMGCVRSRESIIPSLLLQEFKNVLKRKWYGSIWVNDYGTHRNHWQWMLNGK